eukprot:UN02816
MLIKSCFLSNFDPPILRHNGDGVPLRQKNSHTRY